MNLTTMEKRFDEKFFSGEPSNDSNCLKIKTGNGPFAYRHADIGEVKSFVKQELLRQSEEVKKAVETWLCQLANVENPDKAVGSIKDLIYGQNPPDMRPNHLIALGKAEALAGVLRMFSKPH